VPLLRIIPDETHIRFMWLRRFMLPLSAIATVLSLALFFGVGLNLGIDFRGGTLIEIRTEGPADVGELFTLQRAAFVTEAQVYGDPHIPSLVQTLKGLEEELSKGQGLKAMWGHRLAGAIRGRIEGATCLVGRICVAPDLQGRGIGSALLEAFEASVALEVARFELHVGSLNLPHLRLFGRFGYHEFRREHSHGNVEWVFMEKPSPGAASSL
jgi:ribosomal protein S18 acetylase RimI-like enzyme